VVGNIIGKDIKSRGGWFTEDQFVRLEKVEFGLHGANSNRTGPKPQPVVQSIYLFIYVFPPKYLPKYFLPWL